MTKIICGHRKISTKSHRDFGEIKIENIEPKENYGHFRIILRCQRT